MTNSGLTKRLQQHSRRSGLAVGLSMALAIAVCMGAFTWIYVQLEPWVQDFAGAEEAPPTRTPTAPARSGGDEGEEEQAPPTDTAVPAEQQPAEEQLAEEDESEPTEKPTEETSDAFEPDYVVATGGQDLYFRSEPSRAGGDATVVRTLTDGTPLQYLNEEAPADNPDDGTRWLKFRLEDGTEGWLRELDVAPTDT